MPKFIALIADWEYMQELGIDYFLTVNCKSKDERDAMLTKINRKRGIFAEYEVEASSYGAVFGLLQDSATAPAGYTNRSMSVGDLVIDAETDFMQPKVYLCCPVGWEDVSAIWFPMLYNPPAPSPNDPPPGSWAATARMMAMFDDPEDPYDWDRWKDEMKESEDF